MSDNDRKEPTVLVQELLVSGYLSDIVLVSTSGTEYKLHRKILEMRLAYFEAQFDFNPEKVRYELPAEIDNDDVFTKVIRYIYQCEVRFSFIFTEANTFYRYLKFLGLKQTLISQGYVHQTIGSPYPKIIPPKNTIYLDISKQCIEIEGTKFNFKSQDKIQGNVDQRPNITTFLMDAINKHIGFNFIVDLDFEYYQDHRSISLNWIQINNVRYQRVFGYHLDSVIMDTIRHVNTIN